DKEPSGSSVGARQSWQTTFNSKVVTLPSYRDSSYEVLDAEPAAIRWASVNGDYESDGSSLRALPFSSSQRFVVYRRESQIYPGCQSFHVGSNVSVDRSGFQHMGPVYLW
ncbi:MAG: hypothetical protein ACE5IJ_09585, partial [Thermoplasmata archaeon]